MSDSDIVVLSDTAAFWAVIVLCALGILLLVMFIMWLNDKK
jgi:hypothetical protein